MSKVYKYRANQITSNREKDSILLSKNIIFASPIKFLNDPFEGSVMLPKADRHEHWVTPINARYRKHRNLFFIKTN